MPSTESLVCLHVPLPGGSCTPILMNRFLALCPSQSQSLLNVLKGQQLNVSFSFPPLPSHPDFVSQVCSFDCLEALLDG